MTVNIGCLEIELSKKLNDASLTEEQILLLAKSIKSFKNSVVITVATVNDLPDPGSVTAGSLYFAESAREFYIASQVQNRWRYVQGDRLMFSWGYNGQGRLGDGTILNRSSPVAVVGGFTDWCVISGGGSHSVAIRTNGTAWSWGTNNNGQLGDGTVFARSSPVAVTGGIADWSAIDAGCSHTLAIRTNGTAWAWGNNNNGRLGDGTTVNRSSPVSVIGGFTDWCAIDAGRYHSAAVRTNGTAWSWGSNTYGQLGHGTATTCSRSSPVAVIGGFTDWCAIAAGDAHSLAMRTNSTLWSWGCNGYGRLGDGTITDRSSPISVIGGFTDWCAIAAGDAHSLAIRTNGTMWSWGFNGVGRLGDNTIQPRSSPVSVIGGITDWCVIDAGNAHNLAMRTNGTMWSWGFNNSGRLGDGTVCTRSSPVAVTGGITDWLAIAAGTNHSAGIRSVR